jgi:hypothetical protein
VAGCCECGDEPSCSCATELDAEGHLAKSRMWKGVKALVCFENRNTCNHCS